MERTDNLETDSTCITVIFQRNTINNPLSN